MICKLCLQDRVLLKKSHIIPDFMYKELFDNKHFIHIVALDKLSESRKISTGEFEPNILCSECDNVRIGANLESYASNVIYGGKISATKNITFENIINPHGVKMIRCKGVDYSKFKLFLLSILWRASISERNFFKNVRLGSYEEELRKMILNNDPKEPADFPCFISTYRSHKNLAVDLIPQPQRYKLNNILGYKFLIGGLLYVYLVSNKKNPKWLSDVAINKNNKMSIVYMDDYNAKQIINHFMGIELIK